MTAPKKIYQREQDCRATQSRRQWEKNNPDLMWRMEELGRRVIEVERLRIRMYKI